MKILCVHIGEYLHVPGGDAPAPAAMSEEEKAEMRRKMEEEIRAQLEANAASMMSWDDKLKESRQEVVEVDTKAKQAVKRDTNF